MSGLYCPVAGCEKHRDNWTDDEPPFVSVESLRGHIAAKPDDDHRDAKAEGAWKEAPEAPLEAPEAGDGEGGDDPPEGDPDGDGEADDQDPEGGDDPPDDPTDMVSPEEYEVQRDGQTQNEAPEAGDGEGGDDPPSKAPSGGSTGGSPLPEVPPMWTLTIICGVFAAVVLWRVWRARSSDDPAPVESVEEPVDEQPDRPETPLLE